MVNLQATQIYSNLSEIHNWVGGFLPTHLKNMRKSKMGGNLPQINWGENSNKKLSCHHLDNVFSILGIRIPGYYEHNLLG